MLHIQLANHLDNLFRPRAAEFSKQPLNLCLDCHDLDTASVCNVLDLHPVEQIAHKASLRRSQLGYVVDEKQQTLLRTAKAGIFLQHRMLNARAEHRLTLIRLADMQQQLVLRTALDDIIHRARAHRHENHVLRFVRRQKDDDGIRIFRQNVLRRMNTRRRRFHFDVHQDDVVIRFSSELLRLRAALRRADNLHVLLRIQGIANVFPKQRKVIRNQYSNHLITCPAHIWAAARRRTSPSPVCFLPEGFRHAP